MAKSPITNGSGPACLLRAARTRAVAGMGRARAQAAIETPEAWLRETRGAAERRTPAPRGTTVRLARRHGIPVVDLGTVDPREFQAAVGAAVERGLPADVAALLDERPPTR